MIEKVGGVTVVNSLIGFVLLVLFFIPKLLVADIIPHNYHSVGKCVKIVNVDEFPGISFVEVHFPGEGPPTFGSIVLKKSTSRVTKKKERLPYWQTPIKNRLADAATCFSNEKYRNSRLFALKSSYLKSKGLEQIDFQHDPNVLKSNIQFDTWFGLVRDENSLQKEVLEYKVLGFRDAELIVYLSKKTEMHLREPVVRQTLREADKKIKQEKLFFNSVSYKAARINSPSVRARSRNSIRAEKDNNPTFEKLSLPKSRLIEEYVEVTYQPPEIKNLRHSFN